MATIGATVCDPDRVMNDDDRALIGRKLAHIEKITQRIGPVICYIFFSLSFKNSSLPQGAPERPAQ